MNFKKSKLSKALAGFAMFAMMFAFGGASVAEAALTQSQIDAIVSLLQSFGADAQTVADVRTTLEGGTPSGGSTTGGSQACAYTFATNLSMGDTGADVMNLQKVLNMNSATQVASSGVGSPGNETSYFGSLTKAAVIKFQEFYASDVLAPVGLSAGTGYVGPSTRAKLNSVCASSGTTGGTTTGGTTGGTTTGTTGTGLSVSAPVQPANSLAVASAARVPFTKVTLTNNGSSDVTVNSFTVERTGLAADSNFSGVVLLDESGTQLGIAKTLNTNHQATIGEAVTIPAGSSRTFTVGANMAAASSLNAGEVASFAVVAVNTSAAVSGSLPITGAQHTINATLSIGSVDPSRGPLDPNANQTKEVGTTGYTFSSLKITAGSTEKIRLNSIRFNQSGSAASGDLANVKIVVDGTEYTPVVSADGKYYSATFGTGIVIDKGMFKEVSIKGDIVSGSGRTIAFDVYKVTDINVTGETYGYGLTPSTSGTGMSSTSPVYDASVVTVSGGSITVSKATTVASQNIAINVANQPLGAVKVKVEGEPVSVQSIAFTVSTSSTGTGQLTNVTLVDANGAVVAGPVDTSGTGTTITFSDTVTFPIGENVYTVKGKLASTISNGGTYTLKVTPSTQWTTVTGQTTGNTITPSPSSQQTLQTMTAKAGAVAISVSATPAAQTIVAGTQDFTFANIQFDATASGEDLKFVTMPMSFTNGGTASYITGCQLFNGSTALNTGSNEVDSPSAGSNTFTLDSPLTIAKGAVTTLALKCNVSGSATTSSTYAWGIPAASNFSVTGVTSGQSVTATGSASAGQTMTIGNGTLTVSKDASSPSYALASAVDSGGKVTGVNLGVLKFHAANEEIELEKVSLQLTNTASSSASDLAKVTLWDGATQVGEVIFTGSNTNATSTLTGSFVIPKDGDKLMTIRGDFAGIGASLVGTQGALIAVDYDGDDLSGTRGTGTGSGTKINSTSSSDTAMDGVRVFKSFPTVAKISTGIASTLANGDQPLLRFSVTADSAGSIGLDSFSFRLATTTATVGSLNAFAYTDSGFSTPVSGVNASGKLKNSNVTWVSSSADIEVDIDNGGTDTVLQIPAGTTRYFEIRGDVSGANASGDSITTTLQGDSAYPSLSTAMGTAATINSDSNDDFVWSPNATTSSTNNHVDWTNGYGVSGLPAGGLNSQTISR